MAAPVKSERRRYLLFVKECAEDRGQDFAVMALDVRVEHAGQSQQRRGEPAAVLRSFQFTLGSRRQGAQRGHQLAHLLTFALHGLEQGV